MLVTLCALAFIAGLAFGCHVGAMWARTRRAWADLRTTKAHVPVLRKAAWAWSRKAILPVLAAIAALLLAAYAAISGHR